MAKSLAEGLREAGVDASRKNMFTLPPEILKLITTPGHVLYDKRVEDPVDEDSGFFHSILGYDPKKPPESEPKGGGVRVPINVRANGLDEKDVPILEVVAGRRRTKAALRANELRAARGWTQLQVPVIEVRGGDVEMMLIAIEENNREPESPVSTAVKAQAILDKGMDEKRVAKAFGISLPTLQTYLQTLNFIPELQDAFHQGTLGASTIDEWAKVPREKQAERLKAVLESGSTKSHQVNSSLRAQRKGKAVEQSGKKMLSRARVEELREALAVDSRAKVQEQAALLGYILGDEKALKKFPHLEKLVQAIGKKS